ncbi:MAG: response regulator [Mycobacterium sp.]
MTLRVLLVEDDEADAYVATRKIAGDVTVVRSLREALDVSGDGYDCIALDLGLPDASGSEALEAMLREAHCPVVVLTGQPGATDDALRLGAQDILNKGDASADRLRAAIRKAVVRYESSGSQLREARLRGVERTLNGLLGALGHD